MTWRHQSIANGQGNATLSVMEDFYKNDFEKFLSHTNEKQILLREISGDIKRRKITSLLDIGAGNGLLSIPLSKLVSTYVAVEENPTFAETLRRSGLEVIEANFPIEITSSYDMVLAAHSITYEEAVFKPFIFNAWKLVKPGGVLLIITYRGQEDDWTNLIHNVGANFGRNLIDYNRIGYNTIIETLSILGEVKVRKVITTVNTTTIKDMTEALAFVASEGIQEEREKFLATSPRIAKILDSQYKLKMGYSFPFQHFFLTTIKSLS